MLIEIFKVINGAGTNYGSFKNYVEAKEHAEDIAIHTGRDIFIEKMKTEIVEHVIPEKEGLVQGKYSKEIEKVTLE